MEVFILSFFIMVFAALGLGVGTLARGSVLKGSCGGLGVADVCAICQTSCKAQEVERDISGEPRKLPWVPSRT